jgi:ribonuclease HI
MPAADEARERARRLNRAIDRALIEPAEADVAALRYLGRHVPPAELAERVRRRAARLGARRAGVVRRDALIAALYAAAAPRGWFSAWCDGSSARAAPGRAGLGGLVMDPDGRVAARVSRAVRGLDALAAEIAAAAAVLQAALDRGAARLRLHTDCVTLARLWHEKRGDRRLESLRALAGRFRRLDIRAIPRAHNQPAHRLAYAAQAGAEEA